MLKFTKLNTIAGLTLAGAGILNSGCSLPHESDSQVELLSQSFEQQHTDADLHGTLKVLSDIRADPPHGISEKLGLWVPNSHKLVIQIDMVHGRPWMSEKELENLQPHMKRVRETVLHLCHILKINELYHDGITDSNLKQFSDFKVDSEKDPATKLRFAKFCKTSPILGLVSEGKFALRPTEWELYTKQKSFTDMDEAWQSIREGEILNNISQDPNPFAVILLGAEHNLRDNILGRNATYPEKFSYLRLRTNDLPMDDSKLIDWITNLVNKK